MYWPRLALRTASDRINEADVQFVLSDGTVVPGTNQPGYPLMDQASLAEFGWLTCVFADQSEVRVRVAPAGLVAAEIVVEVGPQNYCGAHIAYVTASVVGDMVVLSPPEYRSPCLELSWAAL
jgi:hypothetical protein